MVQQRRLCIGLRGVVVALEREYATSPSVVVVQIGNKTRKGHGWTGSRRAILRRGQMNLPA
jgi:hypothetical protein